MKTIATLMLSMLIGIQFIVAQDQAVPVKEKAYVWNETTHDFGKIVLNDPAAVTFTVTNNSKEPILITSAHPSCGCTIAEYTKEPIKPGESGIVKATYNSAKVGAFTKTITVIINDTANPEMLTIKGEVEEKLTQ